MEDRPKPNVLIVGPGHERIGRLGMALAFADMMARAPAKDRMEQVVLTRHPYDDLIALDHSLLAFDRSWEAEPRPRAPMSSKERARRKKRREMAYESRKRNRRKKKS